MSESDDRVQRLEAERDALQAKLDQAYTEHRAFALQMIDGQLKLNAQLVEILQRLATDLADGN